MTLFGKKAVAALIALLLCCICFVVVFTANTTFAEETAYAYGWSVGGTSGMGGSMIESSCESEVIVEPIDGTYYVRFTVTAAGSMENLEMRLDGKMLGMLSVEREGDTATYMIALSEEDLHRPIAVSAYVREMRRDIEFTMTIDENAARTEEIQAFEGERPARFVPELYVSGIGNEYTMETGDVFNIGNVSYSAVLGENNCDVTVKAYSPSGEEIPIDGGSISLDQIGDYKIVYRAESDEYLTSYGNPSSAEYTVVISSRIGADKLAYTASEGISVQASILSEGVVFSAVQTAMRELSESYSVYDLHFYTAGQEITDITAPISVYLRADAIYDRNEVVVYHMAEDGTLTEIAADGYGRYVRFDTSETGTFIVCIPGVAFVMPMWGYAVILIACAFVVAAAVTVTVILVRRKKKARKSAET